jgi:hypothetical protein
MSDAMTDMRNNKALRDQIEALRQRVAELDFLYSEMNETARKYLAERTEARQQLAACEKDAKRYQWLRTLDPRKYTDLWMYCLNHDVRFDERVDEAMK